jgi:hypothetical protein
VQQRRDACLSPAAQRVGGAEARVSRRSRRAGVVMTNTMRTLTVSRLYREWGDFHWRRECPVPAVRLNGKWLAALGFEPGQKIRVTTNGATITLAPISFESELRRYRERAQ